MTKNTLKNWGIATPVCALARNDTLIIDYLGGGKAAVGGNGIGALPTTARYLKPSNRFDIGIT